MSKSTPQMGTVTLFPLMGTHSGGSGSVTNPLICCFQLNSLSWQRADVPVKSGSSGGAVT